MKEFASEKRQHLTAGNGALVDSALRATREHLKTPQRADQSTCPACYSDRLVDFFELQAIPIHVCVLFDSPEKARNAPVGDIGLTYCRCCGFVHNRLFEPGRVRFEPGYEASLFHSGVFRSYLQGVATRLVDNFGLRNKQILEIGCGAGDFLRMLCRMGGNHGTGIDPTVKAEVSENVGSGTVRFIRDYFSEKYDYLTPEFICCLSVFEDIPRPLDFLLKLRRMIGNRRTGIYFEVYNGWHAFEHQQTWSIHYEQCNYFNKECYLDLFRKAGFEIRSGGTCYEEGQYLYVEALAAPGLAATKTQPARNGNASPDVIEHFSEHHRRQLQFWTGRFADFKSRGKRVVTWGSGGKGITFLNELKNESTVRYVVDINPERQGKYLPGTAQEIVAPEFLLDYKPNTIIVTNPLYQREIEAQVSALGISCNFLSA